MTTQTQLLALLKTQPYAFLQAYGTDIANANAEDWNAENPEDTPITGEQIIDRDYGNVVGFVDEECMGKPIDDIVMATVYHVGGGEGGGENVVRVWSVTVAGEIKAYIRVTGYYASYRGTEYNESAELVEARDVLVTQYFSIVPDSAS